MTEYMLNKPVVGEDNYCDEHKQKLIPFFNNLTGKTKVCCPECIGK